MTYAINNRIPVSQQLLIIVASPSVLKVVFVQPVFSWSQEKVVNSSSYLLPCRNHILVLGRLLLLLFANRATHIPLFLPNENNVKCLRMQ
jgi:hypothetical protein